MDQLRRRDAGGGKLHCLLRRQTGRCPGDDHPRLFHQLDGSERHLQKENQLLFYLVCSIVTGFLGCILVRVGIGVHLDKILIGCIMLTIPGIPITYAMRDMLLGESITGLFRFVESLLIAASIAGGFLLATVLAEEVL